MHRYTGGAVGGTGKRSSFNVVSTWALKAFPCTSWLFSGTWTLWDKGPAFWLNSGSEAPDYENSTSHDFQDLYVHVAVWPLIQYL